MILLKVENHAADQPVMEEAVFLSKQAETEKKSNLFTLTSCFVNLLDRPRRDVGGDDGGILTAVSK